MFKYMKILIYIIYPLLVPGLTIFCLLTCGGGDKSSAPLAKLWFGRPPPRNLCEVITGPA